MNRQDAKMKQRYFEKIEDFLEVLESVGGSGSWETWREQTLQDVFESCARNGVRVSFYKEHNGSPYDAK